MKRDFAEWLLTFTDSIANYKYYIDFETIYKNAEILIYKTFHCLFNIMKIPKRKCFI